jgi:hypothetical protein
MVCVVVRGKENRKTRWESLEIFARSDVRRLTSTALSGHKMAASAIFASAVRDTFGFTPVLRAERRADAASLGKTLRPSSLRATAALVAPAIAERARGGDVTAPGDVTLGTHTFDARAASVAAAGAEADWWSRDAPRLRAALAALPPGAPNALTDMRALFREITHLSLVERGVRELDAPLAQAVGVTELNVSRNKLRALAHLPPRIRALHAHANALTDEALHFGRGTAEGSEGGLLVLPDLR